MEQLFLTLVNQSIPAGWLVLAILLLRLLLRKSPKSVLVGMWALVGVRLVCPFSFQSVLSLIPRTAPLSVTPAPAVPAETVSLPPPVSGTPAVPPTTMPSVSPMPPQTAPQAAPDTAQLFLWAATVLWLVGIAAIAVYTLFSYRRLRHQVREAAFWQDNVWLCDQISTPFVLGVVRPRIYLPSRMDREDRPYVLAHEQAHLQRHDHWWKPLGFLLLTVYWFHPLLWAAYILLCRDVEMACDEKVIRQLGATAKRSYSEALIRCSAPGMCWQPARWPLGRGA